MTWIALLLADPSPSLRLLVLRDLLATDASDPELRELAGLQAADPIAADLLARQGADGAWSGDELAGLDRADGTRATSQALLRLGYLGFGPDHPAVARGAAYLFSLQQAGGSWPLARGGDEETAHEGSPSFRCKRRCRCARWPPAATRPMSERSTPTSGCWRSA